MLDRTDTSPHETVLASKRRRELTKMSDLGTQGPVVPITGPTDLPQLQKRRKSYSVVV